MKDSYSNNIKKSLLISSVIFFVILIFGKIIIQNQIKKQTSYSKLINFAGKQRMLSQKLTKEVLLYLTNNNEVNLKQAEQDFRIMRTAHNELKAGSLREESLKIEYESLDLLIEEVGNSLDCISVKCENIEVTANSLNTASNEFLVKMDQIVKHSETMVNDKLNDLRNVEIIFFFSIFLLVFVFFFSVFSRGLKQILNKNEELLDRDRFLSKIESIAKIGCWELDIETNEIDWSNGIYEIHKLPPGSPTNKVEAINFYAPHERERITKCLKNSIESLVGYDEEFEFQDNEGNKKWVRAIGEPLIEDDGSAKKLTGVFQDVTYRKNTEIKLDESKRYLELAMEGSGIGIWDWYLKDNSVVFNNHWADMLGVDHSSIEMVLGTWQDRVHPDDIEKCYNDFVNYSEGKSEIYENIHRLRHEDGRWLYILSRGRFSSWNKKGKPTRFTGIHLDITERHKLQEDQKFILSSANVGIWRWDILKNELFWDESMYEVYGVKKENFVGAFEAWECALHEDYKEEALKLLNDAVEGNAEFDTTFAIRTEGNDIRYIGAKAQFERDENGRAVAASGINWDKTEEHFAELEMKAYVKGLDKYAIITKTDARGVITHVNQKFIETSKFSEEELLGQTHQILNSNYHSKDFFKELWLTIQSGETWRGEIRNKAKDGSYYWVDTTITPSIDVRGRVSGYLSFRYDITELKETQFKLTESLNLERASKAILDISDSQKSLKAKLENVLEAFFDMNYLRKVKNGAIFLYDNSNDLELIAGREFLKPDDGEDFEFKIRNLIEKRADKTMRVHLNKSIKNQNKRSFYQVPLKDGRSDFGFMLFEMTDDTEESEKETQMFDNLMRFVSQLIRKAHDKEEYHKQKQIALHNSKLASVGELAAGVGHEINNPLAIVKGYLYNLNKKIELKKLDEKALSSTINKMSVAALRIEKIVNGLRTFSRSDGESIERVPIVSIIKESLSMIKEIYAQEGIKIILKNENPMKEFLVNGNRGRIQQALMNLITNAKDATEGKRDREIKINISHLNDKIEIAIEDNGVGIAEHVREKIFNAFFTTKDVNKGTGIGLSLAHSIISEYRGAIDLDTVVGKGSVFTVKLPVKVVTAEETKKEEVENSILDKKFLGLNVMLVDDEEGIRELLEEFLYEVCASVTSFKNGKAAFHEYCLNPNKYDLIISDMQMPEMNGATLLKSIRAQDTEQPKFIFITGGVNINFEDHDNEYNKLIDGYLFKPFNEEDVYKTLSSFSNKLGKAV